MKTINVKSEICTKCSGSGIIDWSNQDGGVCYKCEGLGYIGELPEGFVKCNIKEVRNEAKQIVKNYILKLIMNGHRNDFTRSYEMSDNTIAKLIELKKVIMFKYNAFWMSLPNMQLSFGGDGNGYSYELTIGGKFVTINPVKK